MNKTLLAILATLITSCCTKVEFKKNDYFWFDKYEKGEKIIFLSDKGDYDTIEITETVLNKPTGDCNLMVSNYDRAFARVDYGIKKDTFKIHDDYFVQQSAELDNKDAIPVLRLFNMEFNDFEGALIPTSTKLSTLDKEFLECYVFDSRNCAMNYNQNFGMVKFIWSRELGLIRYENDKGESWEFLKKEK